MTLDELTKMCRRLAGKYKSGQMKDDLVQEGLLACLELLNDDPECHPAKLYRTADKAMWDYLNFGRVPVVVPKDKASRAILRGSEVDTNQSYSELGIERMKNVLQSPTVPLEDAELSVEDCADAYERKQLYEFVEKTLHDTLEGLDLAIIKMRYYHNMTLEDVGDALGLTKQAVSRRETATLEKLKRRLKHFVN